MLKHTPNLLDGNPERALLHVEGAVWGGLKLGYFEAADHDQREHFWMPHPCVAMLACGRAKATIHSGAERTKIDIAAGVAGVFGPEFEVSRSTWQCVDARRILIELEESAYQRLGLADELFPEFLRQDLAAPDPDLYGIMTAMVEELQQGCPHGRLYAESLAQGLLRHVHRRYGYRKRVRDSGTACLTRVQFQRVREYVRIHFAADAGLQQLADVAGVSRAHFVRLFGNTAQLSPHAFVIAERVRQARHLLLDPGRALSDISLACGFASQSHFSTMFRRVTGMTPGVYRRDFGHVRLA